jgi:hypothetical protein
MVDLFSVRSDAQTSDVGEFKRRFPGLYLLGAIPADPDDEWSFGTDIRSFGARDRPTIRSLSESAPERSSAPPEPFLRRVEKSDRNPWRSRISVGRAPNNDLILRHHSISKLHAHVHVGTLARLGLSHGGELLLEDAGSMNGTRVEGRRLQADQTVKVASGARLRFGDVECQLLDAAALYASLRSG